MFGLGHTPESGEVSWVASMVNAHYGHVTGSNHQGWLKKIALSLVWMTVAFFGTAGFFSCLWGVLAQTEFQRFYPGAVIGGSGGEIIVGAVYLAPVVALSVFIAVLVRSFSRRT